MLPGPDSQSFSRFLATLGFFLCVAAFVAPGLILRETGVLTIDRDKLAKLTPVARHELERRQRVARDVAKAAPVGGGLVFVVGLGLLLFSGRTLRRQEQAADARSSAELDKLRKELSPQSESERKERIAAEVADDLGTAGPEADVPTAATSERQEEYGDSSPPDESTGDAPGASAAYRSLARRYEVAENSVLNRILAVAPSLFDVRPRVRVSGSLLLDAVLVSTIDQLPDVIVEIKLARRGAEAEVMRRGAEQVLKSVTQYRNHVAPSAVGWLILVVEEVNAPTVDRLADRMEGLSNDIVLSVVAEEEIEQLEFPRGRFV